MMRDETMSAASQLYHGEISDFAKAMDAVIEEVRDELALAAEVGAPVASGADSLTAYADDAHEAQRIWREEERSFINALKVAVAHRLRNRAFETGHDHYRMFADALDAEDYSSLAF